MAPAGLRYACIKNQIPPAGSKMDCAPAHSAPLRPLRSASLTGADCLLGCEAGLGGVGRDALDGRQGDVCVGAGQPRGLGLLGPALQVPRLQGVGPAPPAAHSSASERLGSTRLAGSSRGPGGGGGTDRRRTRRTWIQTLGSFSGKCGNECVMVLTQFSPTLDEITFLRTFINRLHRFYITERSRNEKTSFCLPHFLDSARLLKASVLCDITKGLHSRPLASPEDWCACFYFPGEPSKPPSLLSAANRAEYAARSGDLQVVYGAWTHQWSLH